MSTINNNENVSLVSKELENAINQQIGSEFQAKLQYLNIAAYFDEGDLPQLSTFFYQQAQDEDMHAMKFLHYLVDASGTVEIPAVKKPEFTFDSAETAVHLALQNEIRVTGQINTLMDLAIEEKDHIAHVLKEAGWSQSDRTADGRPGNTVSPLQTGQFMAGG